MKFYIALPFVDVKENNLNNLNGHLTDDYAANFRPYRRYRFESQDRVEPVVKDSNFKYPCNVWIYSVINPETLHIYQEGD